MNGDESQSFFERVKKFFSSFLKNESGSPEQELDCERLRQLKDRKTAEVEVPEKYHASLGAQLNQNLQKEGVAHWCGNSDILVEQQYRTQDNLKGVAQCFEIDPLKAALLEEQKNEEMRKRAQSKTVTKMNSLKEATKSLNESEVHPEYFPSSKNRDWKNSDSTNGDSKLGDSKSAKTGEHTAQAIDEETCFADEWHAAPAELLTSENSIPPENLKPKDLLKPEEPVKPDDLQKLPPLKVQAPYQPTPPRGLASYKQEAPIPLPPVTPSSLRAIPLPPAAKAGKVAPASQENKHTYRKEDGSGLLGGDLEGADSKGSDQPRRKSTIEAEIDLLMSKINASVPVVEVRHNDSGEWHSLPVHTPQANPQYSDELCNHIEETAKAISQSGSQKVQTEVDTGENIPSIAERYAIDDLIGTSDRHSAAKEETPARGTSKLGSSEETPAIEAKAAKEQLAQVASPENGPLIDTVPPRGHAAVGGFSEEALMKLAGESSTPAKTFEFLAKHDNVEIRSAVARNSYAPQGVLSALATDSDPLVAWQAQVTIKIVAEGCPALGESGDAHSAIQ